jgi:hypothetical protein
MNATGEIAFKHSGYSEVSEFKEKFFDILDWVPVMNQIEQALIKGDEQAIEEGRLLLESMIPSDATRLADLASNWVTDRHVFEGSAAVLAQKALGICPDDTSFLHTLAQAELAIGQTDLSIEHFRSISNQDLGSSEIWLALALSVRGNPGDAEEAMQVLRKYCERELLTHFKRGR